MTPSFTDWLSNLSVLQILCAVAVLTALRLISVRLLTRAGRAPSKGVGRAAIEIADSLIYAFAIAFLLIKPLVAQPFYVPTGSMEPTLRGDNHTNDRVWVDKIGYRLHSPRRGDVVVFIPPQRAIEGDGLDKSGPVHYIKRLIAVGGDRLQVTAGKLVVNGQVLTHADVRRALARTGFFGDDALDDAQEFMAVDHVKFVPNGILANGKFIDKQQLAEVLTGSARSDIEVVPGHVIRNGKVLSEPYIAEDPDYDLKIVNGKPLKADYGRDAYEYNGLPIDPSEYEELAANPTGAAIPKGTYFMMGDNRNDSQDSTEWGPLPATRVVGRADAIFWPINRVNLAL
jgi:signal peptidase I